MEVLGQKIQMLGQNMRVLGQNMEILGQKARNNWDRKQNLMAGK